MVNKEEFIQELQESLYGEVPQEEIRDSLNYYTEYIQEQTATGESEDAVLDSLGSARLIARSIIDAYQEKEGNQQPFYTEEVTYDEDNERIDPLKEERKQELSNKLKLAAVIGVILALTGLALYVTWKLLPVILLVIAVFWIWNKIK